MKTFTRLFILLFAFLPVAVLANAYVHGTVKYANGQPVANYLVHIEGDSGVSATACHVVHIRYTNASGAYSDTLPCNNTMTNVRTWVSNCNGVPIIQVRNFTATQIAESNFVICNPVVNTFCHANFIYQLLSTTATGFPVKFNGSFSTVGAGDTLAQWIWKFGDGTTGGGVDPTHVYAQPGTYTACLTIVAISGCRDSVCQTVVIPQLPQGHCEAVFYTDTVPVPANGNPALRYIRFNSTNSHGSPVSDSIISRRWTFGDGTTLTGNQIIPLHGYAQPGTYTACLYIETVSHCKDSLCKTVVVRTPLISCQPRFTTTASALTVTFSSNHTSVLIPGDSIVSRTISFGDGGAVTNNASTVTHQYAAPGVYNACLTIHTRQGCTSTWCKPVAVVNVTGSCVPFFTREQVAAPARTMRFNSIAAYSQVPNDSIITRKWEFGDGQVLLGNVVNPIHTYTQGGTYTVCLTIYTAHCDKRWCQTIQVLPLASSAPADSVAIVMLYPVPVTTQLNAVIYSAHPNVQAQLAIYDVYGVLKWTSNTLLPQGNSTYNIPTAQLASGPYIFKVTTVHGVRSRNFYKMN